MTKILARADALANLVRYILLWGHCYDTVGVAASSIHDESQQTLVGIACPVGDRAQQRDLGPAAFASMLADCQKLITRADQIALFDQRLAHVRAGENITGVL